jgi:Calcium binding
MAKSRKDPIRENRISDEVIVDAYGPEEQAMGWYYYLDNRIHFPFRAKCTTAKTTSPLRKGETVEVRRMASEDVCSSDMLVLVRWDRRNIAVPLSQLTALDADEAATEAISDWHYWLKQGYSF